MTRVDLESATYIREARERIRRRSNVLMSRVLVPSMLALGPIVLVGSVHAVYERNPYPGADIHNDPTFWVILTLVALLLSGISLVAWLRRTARNDQD